MSCMLLNQCLKFVIALAIFEKSHFWEIVWRKLVKKKKRKEEIETKKWYSIGNGSPYIHIGGIGGGVGEFKPIFKIHLVKALIIDIG